MRAELREIDRLPGGETRPHPAKFSDEVLAAAAELLDDPRSIFDPMAGVGGIHRIEDFLGYPVRTLGMEIEHEWAIAHERTFVGNLLQPVQDTLEVIGGRVDAIVTSPTYGNRMAEHHDARDDSKRMTYRHQLGRPLHPSNSGQLQWGKGYRLFHRAAWERCRQLLRFDGRLVVDLRDHIRSGVRQPVVDWHFETLISLDFRLVGYKTVETPGMGFGANREKRTGANIVSAWDKL